MTMLEIINKVLKRLREDPVASSNTSTYAGLISEFVAEIHQEVALDHDWSSGYKTVIVDCVAGQREYDLSATIVNGGAVDNSSPATNQNSEPLAQYYAYVYNSASSTEPRAHLNLMEPAAFEAMVNEDLDHDDVPCYASLTLNDAGTGYKLRLYPLPDDTYRLRLPFWVAEAELETDGSDDTTSITIPERPIRLGALFLAFNERGEEIGEPGNIAERKYREALTAAKDADLKAREMTNRYDWTRD